MIFSVFNIDTNHSVVFKKEIRMKLTFTRGLIAVWLTLVQHAYSAGADTSIEAVQKERTLDQPFINHCTGEISRHPPQNIHDPCFNQEGTDVPSVTPSLTAMPSPFPTSMPSESELIDRYQCPNADPDCTFDSITEDNVIEILYRYSVETTSDIEDPSTYLPKLEEKLLAILAQSLLAHCDFDGDSIRKLQTGAEPKTPYGKRYLNPRRRLAAAGICSNPQDYLVTGE